MDIIAIVIKKGIRHKLLDEVNEDLLGLELETSRRKISIFTAYATPGHRAMELQNLFDYIKSPIPAYLLADLNTKRRLLRQQYKQYAQHPCCFNTKRPNDILGTGVPNFYN